MPYPETSVTVARLFPDQQEDSRDKGEQRQNDTQLPKRYPKEPDQPDKDQVDRQ